MFEIMYWIGKVDSFYGSTLPKIPILSKNDSNKNCSELNFLQKHGGCVSLSPTGVKLGVFKDCTCFNIKMYWNRKIDSLYGWALQEIPIILKNSSNKNCWKLNFLQKISADAHLFLSHKYFQEAPNICTKFDKILMEIWLKLN